MEQETQDRLVRLDRIIEQHDERMRFNEETLRQVKETNDKLTEISDLLIQWARSTDKRMDEHDRDLRHTDDRLDALINIVERDINERRKGTDPTPQ